MQHSYIVQKGIMCCKDNTTFRGRILHTNVEILFFLFIYISMFFLPI